MQFIRQIRGPSGAAAREQTIALLPDAVHGPNPAYQADVGHARV